MSELTRNQMVGGAGGSEPDGEGAGGAVVLSGTIVARVPAPDARRTEQVSPAAGFAAADLAARGLGAQASVGYSAADFEVSDDAAELIEEAVPEHTTTAYASRWKSFTTWCAERGRVALPATEQTVTAYLAHLAVVRKVKATTMDAHLTAIRTMHRAHGYQPPEALTARKTVAGAAKREANRDDRHGPRKALPILAEDLPEICGACDLETAAGLRMLAVVLLAFALLARRSEISALNLSDVVFVPEGMEVTIRSSKTDTKAKGVVRRIHYAKDPQVCAVRALAAWISYLTSNGITAGPLFVRLDRWGHLGAAAGGRYRSPAAQDGRVRPQTIGELITRACELARLEDKHKSAAAPKESVPEDTDTEAPGSNGTVINAKPTGARRAYTGHSGRRGGATSMLRAGKEPLEVSRHGRWKDGSSSFAGYVEEATGFGEHNPTSGLI